MHEARERVCEQDAWQPEESSSGQSGDRNHERDERGSRGASRHPNRYDDRERVDAFSQRVCGPQFRNPRDG